jgi:hypothetical protein
MIFRINLWIPMDFSDFRFHILNGGDPEKGQICYNLFDIIINLPSRSIDLPLVGPYKGVGVSVWCEM